MNIRACIDISPSQGSAYKRRLCTENGRTGESCEASRFAVTVQTPARLFPSESLLDVCFVSVTIAAIGSPRARSAMKPRAKRDEARAKRDEARAKRDEARAKRDEARAKRDEA
jgi:hypothetical protein